MLQNLKKTLNNRISINILSIILFICILSPICITSCISIKSEYPVINYYRLQQEPITRKQTGTVPGTLVIRDFTTSGELETNQLIAIWNNSKVQKYFYHRWISDINLQITDFFITRLNLANSFSGGVLKSSTMVIPDYILEGQVLEMIAYNSETKSDKGESLNSVQVSLQVNVIRRQTLQTDKNLLLSDIFTVKIPRNDNSINSIVPAYNKALSHLTDKVLVEIQNAIAKDQMIK